MKLKHTLKHYIKRHSKKYMEPNQTNTTQTISSRLHSISKKTWIIVGGAIVALAIACGLSYYLYKKAHTPPPIDPRLLKLQQLEASSKPVTTTIEQRTAQLQALQKSSKKVTTTQVERLAKLQALEASSK